MNKQLTTCEYDDSGNYLGTPAGCYNLSQFGFSVLFRMLKVRARSPGVRLDQALYHLDFHRFLYRLLAPSSCCLRHINRRKLMTIGFNSSCKS